jgi:hypothetical protein
MGLTERPNVTAGVLHALHRYSSLIAMPARKHRIRLRRHVIT